jgi:hypothetical protein
MTFLGSLKVELSDKGEILKILKHAILVQICRESERERWNSGGSDYVLISLFLNLPTAQIVGLSLPQFFSVLSMALLFHQEKKREWKY